MGTVVKEHEEMVVDLSEHGQEYLAVFGGAGGKGNRFFLTNENRAPMNTTPGATGEERVLQLELRTMAHAGLVRGKKTLAFGNTRCFFLNLQKLDELVVSSSIRWGFLTLVNRPC